jgi:hypothetical protein
VNDRYFGAWQNWPTLIWIFELNQNDTSHAAINDVRFRTLAGRLRSTFKGRIWGARGTLYSSLQYVFRLSIILKK